MSAGRRRGSRGVEDSRLSTLHGSVPFCSNRPPHIAAPAHINTQIYARQALNSGARAHAFGARVGNKARSSVRMRESDRLQPAPEESHALYYPANLLAALTQVPAPAILAIVRDSVVSLLHHAGCWTIAARLRHFSRHPVEIHVLLGFELLQNA